MNIAMPQFRWMACLLVAALLLFAGCAHHADPDGQIKSGGYHWGLKYPEGIHTVAVPIFSSKDFHRGVEFDVTGALIKQIEAFTPYKVVDRDRADTILEGEIVSIMPYALSNSAQTNTPQEMEYQLTVNFTWKVIRTGRVLVHRTNYRQVTVYYPTLGEADYVGSQTAAQSLAASIVHEMESPW